MYSSHFECGYRPSASRQPEGWESPKEPRCCCANSLWSSRRHQNRSKFNKRGWCSGYLFQSTRRTYARFEQNRACVQCTSHLYKILTSYIAEYPLIWIGLLQYNASAVFPRYCTHLRSSFSLVLSMLPADVCIDLLVQWYGCRQIVDEGLSTKDFFTSLTAVIFGSIQAGNVFTFVSIGLDTAITTLRLRNRLHFFFLGSRCQQVSCFDNSQNYERQLTL